MDESSIRRFGEALSTDKYSIDLDNKKFISAYSDLVLDFTGLSGWTFKTVFNCIFKTGHHCIFKTGPYCTFDVDWNCTFSTGSDCTFSTGSNCTFDTSYYCTFSIYDVKSCTFKYNDYGFKDILDNGIILDKNDNRHYVLNKEFVQFRKVTNG